MDDLRAAVATTLALTPASRLIAIDAGELVDVAALAVYAAVGTRAIDGPRGVVADPLRLPFVAAIADLVLAKADLGREPHGRLREIWRILAPAGALVLIVPVSSNHSLNSLIMRQIARRRISRQLASAMFEVATWRTVPDAIIVRATKRDGLAPQRRSTATVHAVATA